MLIELTEGEMIVIRSALREWRTVAPEHIATDGQKLARWREERELYDADRASADNKMTYVLAERCQHDADVLLDAIDAVLRDALDRVDVHPCDDEDDDVRAKGLSPEMRRLYSERKVIAEPRPDTGAPDPEEIESLRDLLKQVERWMSGYGTTSQSEMRERVRAALRRGENA